MKARTKSYQARKKEEPSKAIKNKKVCRFVEVIGLSLVVLLVCGNFALPTIFYYLDLPQTEVR